MHTFDRTRLATLHEVMADHVARGNAGGLAWLAARDDHVEVGVAGVLTRGQNLPVARDSMFRIASMTKPMAAVGALILIEECRLRLDDAVDDLLPELADRRVLVDGRGPLDGETVPARRPITVRDLLTFELGVGMDFEAPWPQPVLEALAGLGLGSGPPDARSPEPDEWMRRFSTLPLLYQPGEKWLYNVGYDVLGVLIARASGQPIDVFLAERVFEPLGMRDTAFVVADADRLGSCYSVDPTTGERSLYDAPEGQWKYRPAFPSAAGGLVSTIDDVHAFGQMLLRGGRLRDGTRLISDASVQAMTTDHIGVERGVSGPMPDGSQGWGFGVGVQVRRTGLARSVGSYGWDGGLGSSWANDPSERLVATILTTDMFTAAFPLPAVIRDFWTCLYAALED
jgi:CubicO group peptidase (beta-lactamase class C family)